MLFYLPVATVDFWSFLENIICLVLLNTRRPGVIHEEWLWFDLFLGFTVFPGKLNSGAECYNVNKLENASEGSFSLVMCWNEEVLSKLLRLFWILSTIYKFYIHFLWIWRSWFLLNWPHWADSVIESYSTLDQLSHFIPKKRTCHFL